MDRRAESLISKYKPRGFEDLVGQERAVCYLSQLILRGQIGKSILLHGSVGSGKTSLARLYAKALNGSSLFCVGGMHNRRFSWFGGLANRVVRGDARH